MNKWNFLSGVVITAVGAAVLTVRFFLEHNVWGVRGLIYIALGIYMIRDAVKNP